MPVESVRVAAAAAAGLAAADGLAPSAAGGSALARARTALLDAGTRNALTGVSQADRARGQRAQRRDDERARAQSGVSPAPAASDPSDSRLPDSVAVAPEVQLLLQGVELLVKWLPSNGQAWRDG